jgi:elongation factor 2
MVKFTIDQIRAMMDTPRSIRNISVVAHVDHGKSTLTDSLIAKAGLMSAGQAGQKRLMDTDKFEQEAGVTVKSTSVSLYYERERRVDGEGVEKEPFLINLIDSPGHVDFNSEVTAALRVTDGALVVVDCVESVCVQTETVLRQAIGERIKPILFLNKLDRVFLETCPTLEECYTSFRNSIESVNVICQVYRDEALGDIEVLPQSGKVGFGSGLHAWGFTLADFAQMYCSRFSLSKKKMMTKLWDNNFFDAKARKWVKKDNDGELTRGFCQFVLKPIKMLADAIMAEDKETYEPIVAAFGLRFAKKELEAVTKPKDYLKLVMRTWLPAGDALLDMITEHLPSPVEAQAYRVEKLYTGPLDSPEAGWVAKCDASAPLSMYVSKMVPTAEKGRFVAFGRVFSGTVKAGTEVRILGPDYQHGARKDLHVKKLQRVLLMMGGKTESISDVPAGNVCGLVGVDQYLLKSGTVTSAESFHPFQAMKFSVAAVVQVAVKPKNAAELPKLVDGLRRLSQSDSLVKVTMSKTGEHVIAGAGEFHMQVCMQDLREKYMDGAEVVASEPIVSYMETITAETGAEGGLPTIVCAKAPNKLNRLYMSATPLSDAFTAALENGELKMPSSSEVKTFARTVADTFEEWHSGDARKIWTFGNAGDGFANCVVDATKGVAYLTEIRQHIEQAFREVCDGGALCDEPLRGVRFDVLDARIHSDSAHHGAGQIIPCARKAIFGCELGSAPRLLEPMYLLEITAPSKAMSGVYSTLAANRAMVDKVTERVGTPLTQLQAFLPVSESFGFTELLRKNTSGQAFPQMTFSHWSLLPGDPLVEGSLAHSVLVGSRVHKGLKATLPKFSDFYDKI